MDPLLHGPPDPNLAAMRQEYMAGGLDVADLPSDPIVAFERWLGEVVAAGLPEPNAMVVSTVDSAAAPSARMTLLKAVDARGFVFYTNYTSRKANDLEINPAVSLLFPWHALRRQVIVLGVASRLPRAESDAYFATRPRGSQLGAWASHQSSVIESRAELDERFAELERRWPEGTAIPAPDFWGGYLVEPHELEFWQGRASRLHDRLRYSRLSGVAERSDDHTHAGDRWTVERLAP